MSIWQLFYQIRLNLHVKYVLEDPVQKCIISSSEREKNHLSLQKTASNYRFCTCHTQYAEMQSDQMPTHRAHHFRITLEQQLAIFTEIQMCLYLVLPVFGVA